MKKLMVFLFAVGMFSFAQLSYGQVVVSVRPAEPTVVAAVPLRPSPAHVWIKGYWGWNAHLGRYVWFDGYWALPPHPHMVWIDGHWGARRGGWVWIPGHWRRA